MKLELKDAHCGYGDEAIIQRFVNFSVESGEVCCMLGPNGVGKSTVFKSILGLIPLVGGTITVDGEDVSRWNPKRLASTMAYVSQNHAPSFPYTVEDVVLLGCANRMGVAGQPSVEEYNLAENAMEEMGIYHLRDKIYSDISGGELQLVMIARALCQQPKILVLDEPTAALDYGNAMRVITKIRDLAKKGYAVIMTTHSPDHAFMCDSNVVLLQKDQPMKFDTAKNIITERNMRDAYGVKVRIVEFVTEEGNIVRMCAPMF
jgi:iron complex transport system ATP-binding protein